MAVIGETGEVIEEISEEFTQKTSVFHQISKIILTCIKDDRIYRVRDNILKGLIFQILKERIQQGVLMLTPNLLRYMAVKIADEPLSALLVLRASWVNLVLGVDNVPRFSVRIGAATIAGAIAALSMLSVVQGVLLGIFLMYAVLDSAENCGYRCEDYFEEMKRAENTKVAVYSEPDSKTLLVVPEKDAPHIQVMDPVAEKQLVLAEEGKKGSILTRRSYKKSPRKAKMVTFDEFRKKDPVLRKFKNVEEPDIPHTPCRVTPENFKQREWL